MGDEPLGGHLALFPGRFGTGIWPLPAFALVSLALVSVLDDHPSRLWWRELAQKDSKVNLL